MLYLCRMQLVGMVSHGLNEKSREKYLERVLFSRDFLFIWSAFGGVVAVCCPLLFLFGSFLYDLIEACKNRNGKRTQQRNTPL